MSFSVSGKSVIVTGAAHGVGRAIARHFLDRGANVMFADIDEDALDDEVGVEARAEGAVRYFAGDLRQKLAVANLLSATIDAFDRIDVLVNASRQFVCSEPLDTDADGVAQLLDQNLLTSLRVSQMVARRMITQAERSGQSEGITGSIINLSSIAARLTQPQLLAYSISCAAVEQMTRSLAVALAPRRIRVNAVAYGSLLSASLVDAMREHEEFRDTIIAHTPLGRIASPGELAETVQYLASDSSAFITGQVLTVDGGRSLLDPVGVPAH